MSLVAPTLESFFVDRLASQRHASPRTIASYRDSLKLLVVFVHERTGKRPSALGWEDLSAEMISAFLDHLEIQRHNGPRTLTSGSPRSGRYSSTRRCAILSMPGSSNESWLSLPSASRNPSFRSSVPTKLTR